MSVNAESGRELSSLHMIIQKRSVYAMNDDFLHYTKGL